jgi:hypothetical protein
LRNGHLLDRHLSHEPLAVKSCLVRQPSLVSQHIPVDDHPRVLSIKSECLDHFIVFGEDHLRHLVDEYLKYYLEVRPHQGVGNVPLKTHKGEPATDGKVVCHERLGGVLKHYGRQAA